MAQYGVQATQLSSPDTGAAGFIRKPVVDESGLQLATAALQQIPAA